MPEAIDSKPALRRWQPIVLEDVVQQHIDDAGVLYELRTALCRAPHVRLKEIARFDERLSAHLDGVAVAGEAGWALCVRALGNVVAGSLFTAAVCALHTSGRRAASVQ